MAITFQTNNYPDAQKVRKSVFMDEQGFKDEFDDIDTDDRMIHITAYVDGKLAGCARTFPAELDAHCENAPGRWVFGRLAVLPEMRMLGLGSKILSECEQIAKSSGATEMHLHAQCNAQHFYEKNGYSSYGPIELDEHVEHQWMKKDICSISR